MKYWFRSLTLVFHVTRVLLPVLFLSMATAMAATVAVTFNPVGYVPITASSYTTTGNTVSFSLNYAPPTGTNLMVINNTGLPFIQGTFDNLAQGQAVALTYRRVTYNFVANYYGGTGNDLVLQWASTLPVAWGYNGSGQLGNSSTTDSLVPANVDTSGVLSGKTVIAMAAGGGQSLALCSDGTLAAWGNGSSVAVDQTGVLAGKTVIAVATGYYHSLALCSDGTVAAWGDNYDGQLGNGGTGSSVVPVAVSTAGVLAGKTVIAVAAGDSHSLALCSDGTVAAWGYNADGELGNYSESNSSVPVAVSTTGVLSGKTVIAVAAGAYHSLALCSDGTLAAWGDNSSGQLGDGGTESFSLVPVAKYAWGVLFGKKIIAVAAGAYHSVALCSDSTVAAWGDNYDGQLGNGGTGWSKVPVSVSTIWVLFGKKIIAVAAGAHHSLALCSDGTLAAWGDNSHGKLGNNSFTSSFVPVAVSTASLPAGARIVVGTSGEAADHSFGIIALPVPPAPQVVVEQPAGRSLTSGAASIDFGGAAPGKSVPLVFTIKNTGNEALNGFGFTFDGANPGDFSVTKTPAPSVAAGGSTTFALTFTPAALGQCSATLHFASNDPIINPFNIALTGTGAAMPVIITPPVSQIVGVGQPAALAVDASGGALSYQWSKNNVAVPGAKSSSYGLPATAQGNAGSYEVKVTNVVGGATSFVANLGVVKVISTPMTVIGGKTITLTASAAGPGLTYQWQKNGVPMANGTNPLNSLGTISGTTMTNLSITEAVPADADSYTCLVTMPDPQNPGSPLSLASGVFTVTITIKPVLNALAPGPWVVSGTVTDVVTANNSATTFTVTGLPAGMTMNARTGQLGGKPTVAITVPTVYHLVISASNAAGAALLPVKVDVTVNPLPTNAIGAFNGLVDRDATLTSGYGGTLNVASLNTGVFTGKLTLGALSYSFTAQHLDAVIGANPSATVTIVRKLPLHNLTLAFTLNQGTGELTGTVTDGVIATPVAIDGLRNPWNAVSNKAPLAATYTTALFLDPALTGTGTTASNVAYPQGTGYGTLTISTAGVATWSGRMADGSITTSTTTMAANGEVPLHFMLYTGTGSAHGWVTASADNPVTPANKGLPLLDGSIDWMKSPRISTSTDRIYKAGIPLNTLTVIGGQYKLVNNGIGDGIVFDVPYNGSTKADNAQLVFNEGGLTGPSPLVAAATHPGHSFLITPFNTPVMPAAANNPAGLTLSLNATTGAFSGSFVLKNDADPTDHTVPYTLLSRTVYYYGLIIPRLSVNQGPGYFLLPELPADGSPKTTLSTSPMLSGQVLMEAWP